jgi:hypothetical protein
MKEAPMSVSARLNRRGATLPLTVLLLSLMGVAVAITYSRISSERRITGDSRAQLGAFAVAQSGLNRYLSTINGKPPWNQTVTYNDLPDGTAQVDLRQLRESTITLLPALYAITSRGTYTGGKRYDALTPAAERTVATYALWVPTPFDLNGAFTSLSQVEINGNSYTVSGTDRATASATCPGPQATIPGLATPDGNISAVDFPANINGNPEDAAANLGTPGVAGTAKDSVEIDWAGILAGTAFPADYVSPTWPTSAQFNNWPVTRVNGDLTLNTSGKGILVVTGNLTWNGTPLKTWEGLILVGGVLTGNGQGNIYGALVTGLNVKVGTAVGLTDLGNGTKTYQYDSCALARALGHIGSIQRVRNGWTDTWSSY